ncbi:MAG TPA: phage holin family protein [Thermoanaerobaculia bacterium]|jgi:phage-related holin
MTGENLSYLANLIQRIFSYATFKFFAGGFLVVLHFFFDTANTSAMVAVFFLILIDTATGLIAAYRTRTPIVSHKMRRVAIKVAVYFLLISAGYLVERTLPIVVIDETIIGALAVTELFSILENAAHAGYTVAARLIEKLKPTLDQ